MVGATGASTGSAAGGGGVIGDRADGIGIGTRGADDEVGISDKTRLVAASIFVSASDSGVAVALRHARGCGDSACGTCCGGGVAAERSKGGGDRELPNASSGDIRIRDDRLGSKDARGGPGRSASSLTLPIFAAVADGSMGSREGSGSGTNAFMCSRLSAAADGVATRPDGNPAGAVTSVSITVPWSLSSSPSVGTCMGSLRSRQSAAPEQCFVSLFIYLMRGQTLTKY